MLTPMQARMPAFGERGANISTRISVRGVSSCPKAFPQTASIPRIEDVKPNPIPLWVCVCDLAISYCASRLRKTSSCCFKVL